jgi:predicted metal-dependent HD superfamily phosphohydrolase
MLTKIEKFKLKVNDYDSVLFAIWFHDIVYNVRRTDNEKKSAKVAEDFLNKIKYPLKKIEKITELIVKTKNHLDSDILKDFDSNLFLDLDLLILGEDYETFDKYCKNIRREYSFFPNNIYTRERLKVLENFINQQFIFKTGKIRELYEEQARKNINSEIKKLQNLEF